MRTSPGVVVGTFVALFTAGCCRSSCYAPPSAQAPEIQPLPRPVADSGSPSTTSVFIDSVIVRVPGQHAREALGREEAGTVLLSASEGAAMRERVTRAPGVSVVANPKILTLPTQVATLTVGTQLSGPGFEGPDMVGFENLDAPNWAGHRMRVVPSISSDHSKIGLDVQFASRDLPPRGAKPDRASILASEIRAGGHADIPDGGYVLIVQPLARTGERLALLLTPKVIEER